jgi:hypothetical protein
VDQAERVARRIGVDTPSAGALSGIEQRRTAGEHMLMRKSEVFDADVEMELLRMGRVRPTRGLVIFHALEREHLTRRCVEGRPLAAERPPPVRLIDPAADEGLVEPGKRQRLCTVHTVHDYTLQFADQNGLPPLDASLSPSIRLFVAVAMGESKAGLESWAAITPKKSGREETGPGGPESAKKGPKRAGK